MKLYLVRHGEAVNSFDDDTRVLSEHGIEEVKKMATFLAHNQVEVNHIYHSSKKRAEQTATILAEQIISKPQVEILSGLLPNDAVQPISLYCNHWQKNMMLVGHLPFMGRLVSDLLFEREDRECIQFQTAAIVCLEKVATFRWNLTWFIHPSLL